MRWLIVSLLLLTGCTMNATEPLHYVALGDSYTIGEGVAEADRWPNQLVERLRADGASIELVANPGQTGWTTQQLIDHELPVLTETPVDVVTILIGVNDYVQGVSLAQFEANYRYIIDHTILSVPFDRIILVTIPNFSVTPAGASFGDAKQITKDLKEYNQVIADLADEYDLAVVDIFNLASADTVIDGLHPSPTQYANWVEKIYPAMINALQ